MLVMAKGDDRGEGTLCMAKGDGRGKRSVPGAVPGGI